MLSTLRFSQDIDLLYHLSHHLVHHLGEDVQGDASVRTGLSTMSTYNLIYRYPIYVAYEPRKPGTLHHHLVHDVLEVVQGCHTLDETDVDCSISPGRGSELIF